MKLLTRLRVQPIFWVAPLLVLAALYYLSDTVEDAHGYLLARWVTGVGVVTFLAPAAGALAAYEAGRLRSAQILNYPGRRSPVLVVVVAAAPVFVLTTLAVLVAAGIHAGSLAPPMTTVLGVSCVILSQTAVGLAAGCATRRVIAIPVVLVAGYLWLALPGSVEPFWIRHLTGTWSGCCAVDTQLAPSVLWSGIAMSLAMTATATLFVLFTLKQRDFRYAIGGFAVMSVVTALAAHEVRNVGATPVVARQATLSCSESGNIQVCLWPESATMSTHSAQVIAQASRAWNKVGVNTPHTFTSKPVAGDAFFDVVADATDAEIVHSATAGLVETLPVCPDSGPAHSVLSYVELWLLRTTGMKVDSSEFPAETAVAQSIQSLPDSEQARWFSKVTRAASDCNADLTDKNLFP